MNENAGVEIAEASRRLGISKDAVRRRIQRGTLTASKSKDGHWLVAVPPITIPDDIDGARDGQRDTTGATRPNDSFGAVIATFREQLHAKDLQLAEKDRQISELHVLLQTSQQNEQRFLAATVQDLPHAPQRPVNDEIGAASTESSLRGAQRGSDAPEPRRGAWLRRMLGWE